MGRAGVPTITSTIPGGLCLAAIVAFAGATGAPAVAQQSPARTPSDAASAPGVAAAPATVPNARFDVREYRVLGNSVLSNRDIETVLYPLLGDRKTIDDVQTARGALEKAYHDRGFATVFVDIPEQEVSESIVRLRVTEGRLHSVHISGARYFSERKIVAALPAATPGAVPNFSALQGQLNVVNAQTPDLAVVPVLKAGPTPGTVDMALKVSDKLPLHGSVELNNQYTPDTRPLRVIANLSYNDLFQHFDTLVAQYQTAPQEVSQVDVVAINYAWGELPDAWHPSVYFIDSNSNVPTVGTVGVLGAGQIYGARLGFPLPGALARTQSLTLGLDYKHFSQSIGVAGGPPIETPISYVNLSLAYAGAWSAQALDGAFATTANFGPRGAPNDPNEFADKRYQGRANYFYVKVDGSLLLHLPLGLRLLLRADGQWTAEPLITNESFVATGADGVRGYLEAEVLADRGIKGSLQLQSPVLHWRTLPLGDLFTFYDVARAEVIDPLPGQAALTNISSWGAGLHLLPGKAVTGIFTWANPLANAPYTPSGHSRVLFVVRGAF
jgi:hemolysin activation/secretion protein